MQNNNNCLKKLQLKRGGEISPELQKPDKEAEVYNTNKKCD